MAHFHYHMKFISVEILLPSTLSNAQYSSCGFHLIFKCEGFLFVLNTIIMLSVTNVYAEKQTVKPTFSHL